MECKNFLSATCIKDATVGFGYVFSSKSKILYEEYLVVDIITVIGSVGGTLGMCIGFSFTNMISFLMNILQRLIMIIKVQSANKKISKTRLHYLDKKMEMGEIVGFNSQISKHNERSQRLQRLYHKKVKYIEDHEKLEEKINSIVNAHFKNHMGYEFCHLEGGGLYLKNETYLKNERFLKFQNQLNSKLADIEKKLDYIQTRGALRGWWGGRNPSELYSHQ